MVPCPAVSVSPTPAVPEIEGVPVAGELTTRSLTGTKSLTDQDRPWLEKVKAALRPGLLMAKVFLPAPVPISSEKLVAPSKPSEGVVPECRVMRNSRSALLITRKIGSTVTVRHVNVFGATAPAPFVSLKPNRSIPPTAYCPTVRLAHQISLGSDALQCASAVPRTVRASGYASLVRDSPVPTLSVNDILTLTFFPPSASTSV